MNRSSIDALRCAEIVTTAQLSLLQFICSFEP
jgi:hypothetical protein